VDVWLIAGSVGIIKSAARVNNDATAAIRTETSGILGPSVHPTGVDDVNSLDLVGDAPFFLW
jgi:hypothetical protein